MKLTKQLNTMVTSSELIMKEFNLAMLTSECKFKSRNSIVNNIHMIGTNALNFDSVFLFLCSCVRLSHISNNFNTFFFSFDIASSICADSLFHVLFSSLLLFLSQFSFATFIIHICQLTIQQMMQIQRNRILLKRNAYQKRNLHVILPRTFSMRSSFNISNTSSLFSQFKCMSFDMALLLSVGCALLLSTSALVASAFTFSLDNLFALVVL